VLFGWFLASWLWHFWCILFPPGGVLSNPGDEPQQDTNPDGDIQDGKNFGKRRGRYQITISYRGQGEKTEVASSLWIK